MEVSDDQIVNISLDKAMLLITGTTWYEKYGFHPQAQDATAIATLKAKICDLSAKTIARYFGSSFSTPASLSTLWKEDCLAFRKGMNFLWEREGLVIPMIVWEVDLLASDRPLA